MSRHIPVIETEDLFLAKAVFEDWEDIYHNVWSHAETAEFMMWDVTENEEDAQDRMRRTINFQKMHNTYLVYEKSTDRAIGFAGAERREDGKFEETGIALGPAFTHRGYGKQVLQALIDLCVKTWGHGTFIYCHFEGNTASQKLAESMGFELYEKAEVMHMRDEVPVIQYRYRREI